jgi:REP element-mobilizing transposase RayT
MSNHVHLLLRERTESISISLKRLTVSYAAYYNKRYQRVGHLFQDRYQLRSHTKNKWQNETGSVEPSL